MTLGSYYQLAGSWDYIPKGCVGAKDEGGIFFNSHGFGAAKSHYWPVCETTNTISPTTAAPTNEHTSAPTALPTVSPTERFTTCRFFFVQSVGGEAGKMWQLSEIELYNGRSRIALTDSVSNADGGYDGAEGSLKLIDGSTTTKNCCWSVPANVPIVVTLTLQTPMTSRPTSYAFWTANDYTDRDPTSWEFSCKNGDGAYTTLDTRSGVRPPSARMSQYPIFNV